MNFKRLFFPFSIIFLIFLSACSGPVDCSSQDTSYVKYTYDSEQELCVVSNQIQKDVCGNGIIEDGESFCSCAKDVPKVHPTLGCNGEEGEYLEYTCSSEQTCVLAQNKQIVEQTKSLEFKNSDVVFSARVNLNKPFIQNLYNENKVVLDIELLKLPQTSSRISGIIIDEILIENSQGIIYSSNVLNKAFTTLGSKQDNLEFSLSDTTKYKSSESLKFKVLVSYTKEFLDSKGAVTKTENKVETLTASLGTWEIVNPNFLD